MAKSNRMQKLEKAKIQRHEVYKEKKRYLSLLNE